MTGMEPGSDGAGIGPVRGTGEAASPWQARSKAAHPVGGRPILWKWWLLASALSLAIWAGIVALVT